jgi:hypothetical protein
LGLFISTTCSGSVTVCVGLQAKINSAVAEIKTKFLVITRLFS